MVTLIWGEGRQEAHRGGCSTAMGSRSEGIGAEGMAGGRWRAGVGAGRRPGGARGGADVVRGGPVWAGIAEALGGSGAAPVALFGVSAR
jgi:hypothetical protein